MYATNFACILDSDCFALGGMFLAGEVVLALPLDEDEPDVFDLNIEQRQAMRLTERIAIDSRSTSPARYADHLVTRDRLGNRVGTGNLLLTLLKQ